MKWRKLGRIFQNSGQHPKLLTHAANPLPIHLDKNIFRFFYSGRDSLGRSSVGAVDIDLHTLKPVNEFSEPLFLHGDEQSFYSHGVSIGNTYSINNQLYMLFMGWKVPVNGHWYGQIGRLKVDANLNLTLDCETPFLKLDNEDPISLSYPWVHYSQGQYEMWYGSTATWDAGNGEMVHEIKHASSADGHSWQKHGNAIPYHIGKAQAFSRPSVYDFAGSKHMLFSFRSGKGTAYRIGESVQLQNQAWSQPSTVESLLPSSNEWDSDMLEYPFVWQHKNKTYMAYNGNEYGKSGFGLAILDTGV